MFFAKRRDHPLNKKLLWITRTGVLLALLITLQAITKPLGQLVTGSCVNTVLAIAALVTGLPGGLTIALCSPILAYLLGIAPQILTVPAIMIGNGVFVTVLYFLGSRDSVVLRLSAWLASAFSKFITLYALVSWLLCGVLAQPLLEAGVLKPPMLTALPATFSWPQLFTALIGGGIALMIAPILKKVDRT